MPDSETSVDKNISNGEIERVTENPGHRFETVPVYGWSRGRDKPLGLAYVIAANEVSRKRHAVYAVETITRRLTAQFKRALINEGYVYGRSDEIENIIEKTRDRLKKLIPNECEVDAVDVSDLAANLNDVFRFAKEDIPFSVDLVASSHAFASVMNAHYDRMMAMISSAKKNPDDVISEDLVKYAFHRLVVATPTPDDTRDVFVTENQLRNWIRQFG